MVQRNDLPKVQLRALEPHDIEFLYYMENDRSIWNVGVTNVPYSRHLLAAYIESSSGDIYTDKQVRLIVEDAQGVPMGIVDLVNFSPEHHRAELGIVVQSEYRRKGYATSVLHKILAYGKNVLHLRQIYAVVSSRNENSIRMLENVGFQRNMEMKGWLFDGNTYHSAYLMQIFL